MSKQARHGNRRFARAAVAGAVSCALSFIPATSALAAEAASPPAYSHIRITEEVVCLSYTADFMRALVALAKSNDMIPTKEMVEDVRLARDELSTLVDQAPDDLASALAGVRTAFTEGHQILTSGKSGRFTNPDASRGALLAYVYRCQQYPLDSMPGKLRPPETESAPQLPTPNDSPEPVPMKPPDGSSQPDEKAV